MTGGAEDEDKKQSTLASLPNSFWHLPIVLSPFVVASGSYQVRLVQAQEKKQKFSAFGSVYCVERKVDTRARPMEEEQMHALPPVRLSTRAIKHRIRAKKHKSENRHKTSSSRSTVGFFLSFFLLLLLSRLPAWMSDVPER